MMIKGALPPNDLNRAKVSGGTGLARQLGDASIEGLMKG
jgi:hypothetical protein